MHTRTLSCTPACTARLSFVSTGFLVIFLHFVIGLSVVGANDHALREVRPSESLVPVARPVAMPEQEPLDSPPVDSPRGTSPTPTNSAGHTEDGDITITASVSPLHRPSVETGTLPPSGHTGTDAEHSTRGEAINDSATMSPGVDGDGISAVPVTSASPPNPETTETIEEVFVPLKEWKQKKLEDIESRVRKINELDASEDVTSTRRVRTTVRSRPSDGSRKSSVNGVCLIPACVFPWVPSVRQDRCPVVAMQDSIVFGASTAARPTSSWKSPPDPTDVAIDRPMSSYDRSFEVRSSISAEESTIKDSSDERFAKETAHRESSLSPETYANLSLPYGPIREATATQQLRPSGLESHNIDGAPSNNSSGSVRGRGQSLDPQEAGSPIDTLLAIPLVGDIIRSLKDASSMLTSAPKAPVQFSFRSFLMEAPLSCQHTNSTANHSRDCYEGKLSGQTKQGQQMGNEERVWKRPMQEDPSFSVQMNSPPRPQSNSVHTDSRQAAKEKPFNFASADAGARIISSSSGVVGAKNVIEDSVDRYLLAPCTGDGIADSRWIEIELSEDVILESLETGNFEYYSSSARKLAVLGAGSYPPTQWSLLGVFDFADVRTLQRFQIEKRVVTRYLRILFSGKQGHEYYCPISTIQAFGKNLIADWKDVFEKPAGSSKGTEKISEERSFGQEKNAMMIDKSQNVPHTVSESVAMERSSEPHTQTSVHGSDRRSEDLPLADRQNTYPEGASEMPFAEEGLGRMQDVIADLVNQDHDRYGSPRSQTNTEPSAETNEPSQAEGLPEESLPPRASRSDTPIPPSMNKRHEEVIGESMSEDDQIVLEAVRADALSSVSGDDNIFRKVTRLIRLLELNQTLTNQYIDTHLSRFAKALSKVQLESAKAQQLTALTEQRMIRLMASTEGTIRDIRSSAVKRDVLICVLVVLVAFLLGTHWVLWTAVGGARLHGSMEERYEDNLDGSLPRMIMDETVLVNYRTGRERHEDSTQRERQSEGTMSFDNPTPMRKKNISKGRVRSVSSTELTAATRCDSHSRGQG